MPDPAKLPCCPVCADGRKPETIKRLGACCCTHTHPDRVAAMRRWQEGEAESAAARAAGDVREFASGRDAVRWLAGIEEA
jgi:hypothetical protein